MSGRARFLGILLVGLAVIWIALGARSCYGEHQVDTHMQQADQNHQDAANQAGQGTAYDRQEEAQKVPLQEAREEVARLRAEVARMRRPAPRPNTPAGPAQEPPVVVPATVDLAPLVAQQDLLIQAQDRQIKGLEAQTITLTLARDAWRSSAQASAAEAVQLRAALAAKDGLIQAAYWRGFRNGLAVGGASGAAGGGYLTWRAMR